MFGKPEYYEKARAGSAHRKAVSLTRIWTGDLLACSTIGFLCWGVLWMSDDSQLDRHGVAALLGSNRQGTSSKSPAWRSEPFGAARLPSCPAARGYRKAEKSKHWSGLFWRVRVSSWSAFTLFGLSARRPSKPVLLQSGFLSGKSPAGKNEVREFGGRK